MIMRNVAEKSVALHKSGLNCAQSVLCALEEYTQLDPETAKNVAEGFGGGLAAARSAAAYPALSWRWGWRENIPPRRWPWR